MSNVKGGPKDSPAAHPTPAQVAKYIEGHGTHCPFCGSDDLGGDSFEADGGVVWQAITCGACQAQWQDTYRLSSVGVLANGRFVDDVEPAAFNYQEAARDLFDALKDLMENLEDAGETTHFDTGEPLADCVRANAILDKYREHFIGPQE